MNLSLKKQHICLWLVQNTGVCCCFLIQGVFPTLGPNPCLLKLLNWQEDSLPVSHLGSPLYENDKDLFLLAFPGPNTVSHVEWVHYSYLTNMKEHIFQMGKVPVWNAKTLVLEGFYEWFLKQLQNSNFKPIYAIISYDFKCLWNMSTAVTRLFKRKRDCLQPFPYWYHGEGIGYSLQYSWTSLVAHMNSTWTVRDLGLIPGLGRSPGGGHSNPL